MRQFDSGRQQAIRLGVGLILVTGGIGYVLFGFSVAFVTIITAVTISLIITIGFMYLLYVRPLRQVIRSLRDWRYGRENESGRRQQSGPAGLLARECALLHQELTSHREELAFCRKMVERKVWYQTKDLSRSVRQLRRQANIDTMTGLANRRHYEEYSHMLFDYALAKNTSLTCMMIDVDNFKELNDNQGHLMGDRVLGYVGELIRAFTREGDLCARYGGDEFILLLHKCTPQQAYLVAERLRLHFAREVGRFIQDNDESNSDCATKGSLPATEPRLSIGIATLVNAWMTELQELMDQADTALYEAKAAGRNCVRTA